ncbi:MAG: hypothetical protein Q7R79_00400 [bacterium]|nr:hypothetical protein [bacterium]
MFSPKTLIVTARVVASFTGILLVVAALGLSTDFNTLRLGIMIGFFALALLSFLFKYPIMGTASIFIGLLFNPLMIVHLPRHIWVIVDILALVDVAYFAYWATNPYWKGTRFEQYVSTLFPEPEFVIQDRTRDISKFLNRRVESDAHPDFVFRNKKTGKSFAVECKWRAHWSRGRSGEPGLWWSLPQWERYCVFEKESDMPVYVAFGIGGTPQKPKEVHFLELDRLHYVFLTQALIRSGYKEIPPSLLPKPAGI